MPRFLTLAAVVLIACTAAADDLPRFPIEKISIEGTKYASASIVVAESRLVEGKDYSEPELRDAVARINRLPFVLHTDFRLEKGSARGLYTLVITIEETKPLFVRYRSLNSFIAGRQYRGDPREPIDEDKFYNVLFRGHNEYTTAGARMFVGKSGVAHASVDYGDRNRFGLGYTHYDVFGTRASLSALVRYHEYSFDFPEGFGAIGRRDLSFTDHLEYELAAAVPLSGNHALRASWARATYPIPSQAIDPVTGRPAGELRIIRFIDDRPTLSWIYDSTNDPTFPTRGTRAAAGVNFQKARRYPDWRKGWLQQYEVGARRYWELTPRNSASAGATAVTRYSNDLREYQIRFGYGADLWGRNRSLRHGDLRFELDLARNFLDYPDDVSYGVGTAAFAFRNAWGVVRLEFEYTGWRRGYP